MNRQWYYAMVFVACLCVPLGWAAEQRPTAFLGVILDRMPLPEILIKHLGLAPGKGLRIENVFQDSPAAQAGLDRDDILLSVDGQDINDVWQFGRILAGAQVGTPVRLEIIHAGQRRTVEVRLGRRPQHPVLKYPPEPSAMMGWRIGGIFRQEPQSGRWVPFDASSDPNVPMPQLPFPREVYTFNYGDGADQLTVVIEGNPRSGSSKVIVRAGQAEYSSTIDQIDKLPQTYMVQVQQAIQQAKRDSDRQREFGPPRGLDRRRGRGPGQEQDLSDRQWDFWEQAIARTLDSIARYLEAVDRSRRPMDKSQMERLNQIEQQLRQLQQQIDKAQQQQQDRPRN